MNINAVVIYNRKSEEIEWFSLKKMTPHITQKITRVDEGLHCDCFVAKVEKKCIHEQFLKKLLLEGTWDRYLGDYINKDIPVSEMDEAFSSDIYMGLAITEDTGKYLYFLPPAKADYHLCEILSYIEQQVSEPVVLPDEMILTTECSYSRFIKELRQATSMNLSLTNEKVIDVSLSLDDVVGAVEDEKVEEDVMPITPSWVSFKPPSDFWIPSDAWEALLWAGSTGSNILLTGETGTGKSQICYRVAKVLGLDIEAFNFGAMSEPRSALIGNTHFSKEKGTFFSKSRFVDSLERDNMVVLLDELTRAGRDATNLIIPLMDDQRYVSLDEAESAALVYRHESAAFFATANIGYKYTGTSEMDSAINDRFDVRVDLGYPPPAEEFRIINQKYPTVPKKLLKKIIGFVETQRNLFYEEEYEDGISMRLVLACVRCIASGMSPKAAVKYSILCHFSKEGGEESFRSKLITLIQSSSPDLV